MRIKFLFIYLKNVILKKVWLYFNVWKTFFHMIMKKDFPNIFLIKYS